MRNPVPVPDRWFEEFMIPGPACRDIGSGRLGIGVVSPVTPLSRVSLIIIFNICQLIYHFRHFWV